MHEAEQTALDEQCPFFALSPKLGRLAVFKRKDGYHTRYGKKINLEKSTLLPHLLTRSILQDAYFHASHYLAGPHEKIYLGKLQSRYKKHSVIPSEIVQRMSPLLIEASDLEILNNLYTPKKKISKAIKEKTDIEKEQMTKWMVKKMPPEKIPLVETFLHENSLKIQNKVFEKRLGYQPRDIKARLHQAKELYVKNLAEMRFEKKQLKTVEKKLFRLNKAISGEKRKEAKEKVAPEIQGYNAVLNRLAGGINHSSSSGFSHASQERSLSSIYFLNKYGLGLLDELYHSYAYEQKILLLDSSVNEKNEVALENQN